ncbi:MAG: hypothetical protein KatS3mg056_1761 [Chloroflexus sp.]|nr:MAG: hypothetical protein KatS3mg056_1761 [Chloroflexus sp.]
MQHLILTLLLIEHEQFEVAATYLQRVRQIAGHLDDHFLTTRARIVEIYAQFRSTRSAAATAQALTLLRQLQAKGENVERAVAGNNTVLFAQELWMQSLLLIVLGEGGEPQRALELANELVTRMAQRNDGLFRALVHIYRAYLVAQQRPDDPAIATDLATACAICDRTGVESLPFLPQTAMNWAITDGASDRVVKPGNDRCPSPIRYDNAECHIDATAGRDISISGAPAEHQARR